MTRKKLKGRRGQAGHDARVPVQEKRDHRVAEERLKKVAVTAGQVPNITHSKGFKLGQKQKSALQREIPQLESDLMANQVPDVTHSTSPKPSKKQKKLLKRKNVQIESEDVVAGLPAAKKAKNDSDANMETTEEAKVASDLIETPVLSEGVETGFVVEDLIAGHEVTTMSISSSSKVETKVTQILEKLESFSFVADVKPNVVKLHAKAATANKMISVIEIAKRNIALSGGKWYQYNQLDQVLEEKEKNIDTILGRKIEKDMTTAEKEMEGEEGTFESMKTPFERAIEERPKVRAIPTMTIYLSRVAVQKLKTTYGEQTNALTV